MALYGFDAPRRGDPWAALEELRREMDGLLGTWGTGPASFPRLARATVHPPVNLYETDDSLVLTAEVPGVRDDDLEVSVQANQVTLRGRREVTLPEDASVHRRERLTGAFERSFALPFAVDADKAEAHTRAGVLMLRLPKPEQHQRRQIPVRSREEGR